ASLRLVYVGGEELPVDLFGRLAAKSDARLDNTYGPTEAAVNVTYYRCDDRGVLTVPIGVPVWNTHTYVMDGRMQPTPVGVPGELYLGGVQLARGYQGRADLTSDRFVANPFGEPGSRLYRTGDLVRWNRDGRLEFLGRTDFQVKVRGLRIELGEIEAALVVQDGVTQAVVVVHESDLGQQLVGYVVPESGRSVDTKAVREAVGRVLPAYMVPDVLMVVDEFPLSSSGKVDRKVLPVPVWALREFRAPTNPVEEIVAGVFAEVLGVERVGLDDDFFALGGNSLIATRVTARLGAALDTRVPVRVIFEASTVEALAVRAEQHAGEGGRPVLVAGPRPERVPLSLAQQRMWFLNQFDPGSAAYNIPLAIRLTGVLDVAALQAAVVDVLARHEALRTVFPDSDQGPSQVIVPASGVPVDLAPVPVADEDELRVRAAALLTRGFDVTESVPVRGALFRVSESEHVLAMAVHHICADGFSTEPMARDVVVAYASRRAGHEPGWAPLEVQYADYTLWQQRVLGSEDDPGSMLSQQIGYWTGALAGLPDVLALPTDRPRPVVRSGVGSSVEFVVEAATVARVESWAHERGVTPFMVMHAALSVVLAKLSGTTDIAVGSAIAGRGESALDDVVGMFVNTLVLRAECDPNLSFTELVDRVRETDLEAFAAADVPFERLVEKLNPTRSQSFSPLFQVMLLFQNYTQSVVELAGLTIAPVEVEWEAAQFDLSMTLSESGGREGGYAGSLGYATDIFDEVTAAQIAERFVRVLDTVLEDPSVPVGDLSVLDDVERQRVLAEWNDTGHPVPHTTLADLFEAQVVRTPDAPAVVFDRTVLSYAEFDARANRLARYLIGAGVGPESLVGIALRRSADMLVAIYAVVKSGGAYVPIDPDQPAERIAHVVAIAEPALVLTTTDDGAVLPASVVSVALDVMDVSEYSADPIGDGERVAPLRPENPAYVIFTSGSTGAPKGVAIPHGGIVNRLLWMQQRYPIDAGDAVLQKTPTTFDVSVWELFWPLQTGSRVVVAEADGHRDPAYLERVIREQSITTVHFVPSMLEVFLTGADVAACRSLRRVFASGEALAPATAARLHQAGGAALHNLYGPTEASVDVTYYETAPGDSVVPIGSPVWNTRTFVLDARLRPVPVGVVGELYLGGVQLARGYFGRPDLTADRFVANPFGGPGSRLYRSGDLVRWLPSGQLEYLGRTDFQIKLRGLRIELGEIESALTVQDAVAQAVVVVHESDLGQQLVGYVVPAAGHTVEIGTVRSAVGRSLPAYMVPDVLMVLDVLPLNSSGKLDRRALPASEFTVREFRAPTNPVEEIVAGVFAEVLGVDRVGLDDDFFALGGNSLIATRVTARLGAALDTRVPVRVIFEASSVEALAVRLERHAGEGGRPALVAGPRPERVPLSLAQQRMWFFNQFDPGSAAYNIPLAIRLTGVLDVAALQAAVADVLGRHEALRTVFPDSEQGPSQVIVPVSGVPVDLTPEWLAADQGYARVFGFVGGGFDVAAEVPLRVRLFQVAGDEFVLAMVLHHISGDGGSTAPLSRDLVVAYAARRAGHAPGWAPLQVQYADYTLWQQRVLGSEEDPGSVISRQLAYWTSVLADLPDLVELPTDHPRPAVQSPRGARVGFTLSADLAERIDRLGREHRATFFMVAHTALAVLLARVSGAEDIPIGTQIAGRGEAALDDLVGMFGNTLVLRTRIEGAASFTEVLGQVREVDLAGFGHPDVPLERLVEILNPARSTAYSALFQVLLVVHNFAETRVSLPGLEIEPVDTGSVGAKLDLELDLVERFDVEGRRTGIDGSLTYALDLFEESTVAGFGAMFTAILEAVTVDAAAPVGAIELRGPAERRAVDGWNATAVPGPDVTLVGVFEAQVARTPDATAVVFGDELLTYAQFAARVHRLARFLIARGVGPESLVGVAMGRSLDLMVSIYAVLEAGGGYVPIDPEHPADRTAYVVATAVPVLVLTTTTDRVVLPAGVAVVEVDGLDVSGYSSAVVVESELLGPSRPGNVAYAIFTSGSTGRPKGVAVSHRSVVNQMGWMRERYGLGVADTVLHKTPVTFDASVWELFYPLQVGARLVVAAPGGHRDPEYLVRTAERWEVTILEFVPSMLALFLAADSVLALPASLRYVSVGGEALPSEMAARFFDRTDAVLDNTYGPTEATVTATVFGCLPQAQAGSIPIGAPIRNTRTYVLDARLRPAPVGVAGELYLAGVQLARGYVGRPDLTADRFVANPFAGATAGEDAGSRLYRTGDLVRWNRDGDLEYLGRTDFQVKVRGLRIELGEIESALTVQESVGQAVVVVHEGGLGQQLVGYVVSADGHSVDTESVRAAVGRSLPRYMVPDVLIVLGEFPLNSSGKLDRKALPAPQWKVREFRAPTTPVEEVVAGVFAEVLGVERVGLDDDFFALGGNSLIATRVIARLGTALDARVPVRVIFEASTVEALAVRAEQHAGEGGRPVLVAGVRPDRVPLSLAQQRMWFLNQFDPESAAYNIPLAMRLTGELDVAALGAAVTDVLVRHEALRTVFPDSEQGPSQVIVPVSQVPVDLTPVPVAGEDELRDCAARLLTGGFDVAAGVPIRGGLFRVSDSEHVLAMVVHHICADGFSTAPLARDVVVAYAARCAGHEPGWPPLEVQYADYALWQRKVLGSEDDPGSLISQQIEYWTGALADLPDVLALPTDRPRPPVRSGIGGTVEFAVSPATVVRVQASAHEWGATPFMVVHAALSVVLAKLSGSTDIAVGSAVAGRGEAALDDLVGMFVNTLVLRAECDPDMSFAELVDRVRETDLEAFAHADVPFERLVEKLNPVRSQSFSPLFQVMLAFQNYTQSVVELPGLTIAPVEVDWTAAQFDLSMTLGEAAGGGYLGTLAYAADIFDAVTAAQIVDRFVRVLEVVLDDPTAAVGEVSVLDDGERALVLETWNATG
uniref:non-ribosomal peptide synthetase n=1 Tax=Rhodococcus marinonascens TaxID=38311 RepID=UPI000B03B323